MPHDPHSDAAAAAATQAALEQAAAKQAALEQAAATQAAVKQAAAKAEAPSTDVPKAEAKPAAAADPQPVETDVAAAKDPQKAEAVSAGVRPKRKKAPPVEEATAASADAKPGLDAEAQAAGPAETPAGTSAEAPTDATRDPKARDEEPEDEAKEKAEAKKKQAAGGDAGWVRWDYLRPRLLAGAVLAVYGYFLSDPTLHWGMMLGYERATGARLDVDRFQTNWSETSVQFGPVRAANPSKKVENIVEAEHVSLQLDRGELLRGRYIVASAEIRDLQIGTARDDDGRPHFSMLYDLLGWLGWVSPPSSGKWVEVDAEYLKSQVKNVGKSQAKSLEEKLRGDLAAMQLEAPAESRRIKEFWSKETAEAKAQAEWIKTHARDLQAKLKPSGNVLEKAQAYQEAIGELNQLGQYSDQVRSRVSAWPQTAQRDSASLRGAAERDYAKLHQKVDDFQFSSEDLADYLVGETMVDRVKSVAGWIGFVRSFQIGDGDSTAVDSAQADAKAGRTKGAYFDFFTGPPQPQWWMKELKLTGRGAWQEKPVQFSGTVTDLSSHPGRVKDSAALHLVFQKPIPGALEGKMDRRTAGSPQDTLALRCPEVEMTNQTLGKPDDLQIQLDGGKASLEIDVLLEGDELTGQVRFLQPQTGWTVVTQSLGDAWVAQALQGLQGRSDLDLTIDLSGTVQKPIYKVRSEFPKAIAAQFQGRWKQFAGDFTKRFGEQLAQATKVDEQSLSTMLQQEPTAILGDLTKTLDEVKKLPNVASQPLKGLEKLFRK